MAPLDQLLGRTLLIMAHPDDECIAYGTLLQRMREPHVLYATDGAPEDPYFWQAHGTREAYSKLRQHEARLALGEVGVTNVHFLAEAPEANGRFQDQKLFRILPLVYAALKHVVEQIKPEALATLNYEGGHPDHDSCNLLTSVLSRELGIPAWEAPLYHRDAANPKGYVVQDFVTRSGEEHRIHASPEEIDRKRRMCAQYPSQGDFLQTFDLDREIVRPMFAYDYSRPPHGGKLNYEVWQWQMTGEEVSREFVRFLAQVGASGKQPAT